MAPMNNMALPPFSFQKHLGIMAENKTKATSKSVPEFLDHIADPKRRADCLRITALMEKLSGSKPKMWGDSTVGFGDYHYKYASGREGDWFQVGFSPRKQNLTIYIMAYLEHLSDLLEGLGKYKHGKGCLYINKLEDIDMNVLENLISISIKRLNTT
jgi:hypothetical protein